MSIIIFFYAVFYDVCTNAACAFAQYDGSSFDQIKWNPEYGLQGMIPDFDCKRLNQNPELELKKAQWLIEREMY